MTKRRWNVPGVLDVIPPEGRLTLELSDERGRLKHRTFAENSLANGFRDALTTALRGQGDQLQIGFDQWGSTVIGLDTDDWVNAPASAPTLPKAYCQHRQFQRSIYLSNAADAINNAWWFPVGLFAGANLDVPYAGTAYARGQQVLVQCQRRIDGVRFVVDFGLDQANGFQCNSIGLAGLTFAPDTYGHVFGWETNNMYSHAMNSGYPGGSAIAVSMCRHPGTRFAYWMLSTGLAGTNGISKQDLAASIVFNNISQRTVIGPTLATLGSPTTAQSGITILGTDFWLMDTLRLRRSVIPVDTTYTALNTYSPVSGFTDAACLGLTNDGTNLYAIGSTKVFVISPSTGAVTSSWAHGMTAVVNIYYDDSLGMLLICGTPAEITAFRPVQSSTTYFDPTHDAAAPLARPWIPFTVGGTRRGGGGLFSHQSSNGPTTPKSLVVLDGGAYRICAHTIPSTGFLNFAMSFTNGGCLGSRALVAAPFTKDNTKVLRVTYDMTFAGV